jgi:uncharacterized delta-60 repeat protein
MRRIVLFWFPIMILIVSLSVPSCGGGGGEEGTSTGPLDGKFGEGGKVTTPIGTVDDEAFAIVIQPDSRLVAAGKSYNSTAGAYEFALVRYNTDGSLDTTFGTGGIATSAFGSIDDEAFALIIQPSDEKLVAAGYSDLAGGQRVFALSRYDTDGSLDAGFGTGGLVTTNIGGVDDEIFALAIQTDGKLVAAGYSYSGGQRVFALTRYNTNGTLDAGFGAGGKVITDIGSRDQAFALAIQSNGKVVAAGSSKNDLTGANEYALVRYNDDGSLDASFGTGGVVTTPIGGGGDDEIRGLASLSDGKLVATGYSNNGIQYVFALVRYNTDGTLDPTFGLAGIVTTVLGKSDFAFALSVQSNGKLVTAGRSNHGNQTVFDNKFAVARYNPTGSMDTSFGSKGIAVTPIGTVDDEAFALVIQPDDKLVAAGTSYDKTTGAYQFALIRYSPKP